MSDYLLTLSDIYFIINMVGRMLYRYSELLKNEKFNTDRKIKLALSEKRLFKLDCGFYSFDSRCSELEFIAKKYDNAVFNFDSAFYYYGLTDNIPDKYYLSTKKKARKIKDDRVIQTFMDDRYFNIGITYIYYNNVKSMGGGWIRALSGRARLTAQAEGCQVVGRNLRPAQA